MIWQTRKVSKHNSIVIFIIEDKKEEEKKDGGKGVDPDEVEQPEDENVEFLGKAPVKKETRVTYFRKSNLLSHNFIQILHCQNQVRNLQK